MKKTYIMPVMHVTKIQLQHMIATSPGAGAKSLYNEDAAADGTVLSRESNNDWFDDED